jgi:hypothetical protein
MSRFVNISISIVDLLLGDAAITSWRTLDDESPPFSYGFD